MRSEEIRERFLRYFGDRDHAVVPSASLLLLDDPNLLFVNAGMVPFKPYFLGQAPPPWPRAASVQKCVRTVDIENVGMTTRHNTFFQMAGNFSFGDYFKAGVIPMAWELLTTPTDRGGYGFDPDALWATVFVDDEEAYQLWTRTVGLPPERVQRRGRADNYWHMGVAGPGGPCSEIYVDRGPGRGRDGGPAADEERFLEVWNLVFMQDEVADVVDKDRFEIRGSLPSRNIDTGMGIERMAIILQGVDNVYETDLLRPVIDRAAELAGTGYHSSAAADVRLRVVADHTRTAAFLVADGVVPGNEGRGYVLRRLLRRVIRNLHLLGYEEPALVELVGVLRAAMGGAYPELVSEAGRIDAVVAEEEAAFATTLRHGTAQFERMRVADAGAATLSGDHAFTLHDTYGFPIELTLEMAAEAGLAVDEAGFRRLMAAQQARSREDYDRKRAGHRDLSAYRELLERAGAPEFTGYREVGGEATVLAVLPTAGGGVEVVLDRTPFYAEGGGQLADHGLIRLADGVVVTVDDVQQPVPGLIVHRGRPDGPVTAWSPAWAEVDVERRRAVSRSHTATHLLHRAIRRALGEGAAQAGSQNDAGRLRFDFTHTGGVPASLLRDVQDEVTAMALADLEVRAFVTSQREARRIGAVALFGEKYGESVRVIEVGDYARELCGGTHAARSSQIGPVALLTESSIGTGVRRITGLVGLDAARHLAREHALVGVLADTLKVRPEELVDRLADTLDRLRAAEREVERLRAAQLLAAAGELAAGAVDVAGVAVVSHQAPEGTSGDDLRRLAVEVGVRLGRQRPGVVAVAAQVGGKVAAVVVVTDAARGRGLSAGALARELAGRLGGGGGGRDDIAQAGGARVEALAEALGAVPGLVAAGSA